MKKRIYLSEEIAESAYNRLQENFEIITDFSKPEQLDGIITRKIAITREIISKAKKCKIIANHGTGTDQIDLAAAREFNIPVVSAAGLNARSVAELSLSFILALSYKLKFIDSGIQKGQFARFDLPELQGNEVRGKNLGVIGSGYVAQALGRTMKISFGATVYCYNPHQTKQELANAGFVKIDTLKELFHLCDFVSIHAPLTDETRNLINKEIFDKANPNLILINTARGGIVNEKDLYEALTTGKIKAAACDVFEEEPPAQDNPLFALPNFIGTTHIAGSTKEALERVGNATVDNVEEFVLTKK